MSYDCIIVSSQQLVNVDRLKESCIACYVGGMKTSERDVAVLKICMCMI